MVNSSLSALLVMVAFLTGAAHLWARATGRQTLAFWLKALPILVAIWLVLATREAVSRPYQLFVAAALVASMVGDLLLALPRTAFIPGLVSFLTAHLLYGLAFLAVPTVERLAAAAWLAIPLALYGAAILALLWPHVQGGLRVAVVAYLGVILAMLWLAGALWLLDALRLPFLAALFFVASDSVLALNKFRTRIEGADGIVMVTYYAAQLLFAVSVMRGFEGVGGT